MSDSPKYSSAIFHKVYGCFGFYRSFNDSPINEDLTGPLGKELFEKEQDDLLTDLKNIPKKACDRRVSSQSLNVILKIFFLLINCAFDLS